MNYILTTQTENELYHYGVPGMKWGVKKAGKRVLDYAHKKAQESNKKQKEKREEDFAYRIGGKDGVDALKRHREKTQRKIEKEAIYKAKGKEKGKLIVKDILKQWDKEIQKHKPKGGDAI